MVKTKQTRVPITMSIIGAGRLGTALALALGKEGYETRAVVCRSSRSAKRSAALIKNALALTSDRLNELPPTDLILVTTPDDAIKETATNLARVRQLPGKLSVLHTSGALSSALLSPLRQRGAHTGSIHPLVSISDAVDSLPNLRGAFYCVEGDRKAISTARQIVSALGGHSFSIAAEKKPLYHAAAVMCAGHVVALFDAATEMLQHCGLKPAEAQRILLPLLRSTVGNIERLGTSEALTGTFSRGDVATVKEHLRALEAEQFREARQIYRLLGLRSMRLAISGRKKIDAQAVAELERLLKQTDYE